MRRLLQHSAAIMVCLSALALLAAPVASVTPDRPRGEARPGYVDEQTCAACHSAEAVAWQSSKHRQAMQAATPETVKANFDHQSFLGSTGLTTFQRSGDQFSINTKSVDGRNAEFPVIYTFGVHPLQQYLLPQRGGRLQAFTLAWDTVKHKWFDLQADDPARPGESLHWSGRYQNWNLMCAECHTTALRKGYDERKDAYRTTWATANVGCQACHGPGGEHVVMVRAKKYSARPGYGLPIAAGQVDQCAACHARRTRLVADPVPGAPLLDNYQPDTLRPDLYHADGQQLAEVFEYGSFRQSRMHQAGVVCTDCHAVHSGKLLAEGNRLCTRCHSETPNPAFTGLKARNYDSPAHHFHAPGERGSQCIDCHMPSSNYMVVHARRDHAIRVPRPDLTQQLKTPNACNGCHQDRDAAWAASTIATHFGEHRREPHYGEILYAAREGRPGALVALARLVQETHQPAIVRATAIELFGQIAPQYLPPATLSDPDPAVRSVAAMALSAVPSERTLTLLLPLLADPVRAVRIAAARGLLAFGEQVMSPTQRRAQKVALAEFIAAQQAMADMPAAQLNLARLYAQSQKSAQAQIHYLRALKQDPAYLPARLEFAAWLADKRQYAEAEQVLRAGLAAGANNSEVIKALSHLSRP